MKEATGVYSRAKGEDQLESVWRRMKGKIGDDGETNLGRLEEGGERMRWGRVQGNAKLFLCVWGKCPRREMGIGKLDARRKDGCYGGYGD